MGTKNKKTDEPKGLPATEVLDSIISHLQTNMKALSETIGLSSPQRIYNISYGKGGFSKDIANKIVQKYPELNILFILNGEGDMLKTSQTSHIATLLRSSGEGIPLIPIDAMAGFQSGDNEGVTLEQCERYTVPEFEQQGVDFLIRVSGSSMHPKYSNGDILACKKIQKLTFVQWGKVYVLDTAQGSLVKRLFEDKTDKQQVVCKSDNAERYPEFQIHRDDIRSVSIVIGVIRLE